MVTFTLYTRPECHLCEEMQAILGPIAAEAGADIEKVDISGHPDLEERFGTEVPVLFVNGRKAAKYRTTSRELRRLLRSLT